MTEIVWVRWRDSAMRHEQVDEEDLPTPSVLETVGWLSKETDDYIVISRDHSPSKDSLSWRGNLAIPHADVLERGPLAMSEALSGHRGGER